MSPVIGKKFGLRRASAIGFGAVFVMLVLLGFFYETMPIWLAFVVPSLFILFHSGGRVPTARACRPSRSAVSFGPARTA